MDQPIGKPVVADAPPSDFLRHLTGDSPLEHSGPGRPPEEDRARVVSANAASDSGGHPFAGASTGDGKQAVARPPSLATSAGSFPGGARPVAQTVPESGTDTQQQRQQNSPTQSTNAASKQPLTRTGSEAGTASVTSVEQGRSSRGTAPDGVQPDRGHFEEQGPHGLFEGLDIRPDMSGAERAELRRRLNPTKEDAGLALVRHWFELIHDLAKHGTPYKKVLLTMLAGRDRDRFKEEFGEDHKKLGRAYAKIRAEKLTG